MEEEIKPKKSIWKKWWFWLIIVFVVAIVASVGGEKKETTPEKQSPQGQTKEEKLRIGDEGILNNNSDKSNFEGGSILAVDEKAFDDFIQALVADDKLGYSQMLGAGKLFIVDNGTAVKVISIGLFKREVRILEGDYLGRSGWIAFEFVVSK